SRASPRGTPRDGVARARPARRSGPDAARRPSRRSVRPSRARRGGTGAILVQVRGRRTDTGRVPALIRCDHAVARTSEGGNLLPPGVTRLREPMQHQDQRRAGRPSDLGGESSLGGGDRVARVHGGGRTVARGTPVPLYL